MLLICCCIHAPWLQELAKNMQKQKRDMVNILNDTRGIQADIATSWDTMKRSYTSVDEMIFRDARDKGDAVSKKMYKQLVATHECFASLCRRVENTGVLQVAYLCVCVFVCVCVCVCVCVWMWMCIHTHIHIGNLNDARVHHATIEGIYIHIHIYACKA